MITIIPCGHHWQMEACVPELTLNPKQLGRMGSCWCETCTEDCGSGDTAVTMAAGTCRFHKG